ncbi:TetR/AcrR family transcriptional regulator [Nocardiopsis oceani]
MILDHARSIILEKGYQRATMSGIAKSAGVAKGALYLEFPAKQDLLEALLNRSVRSLTRTVRAEVAAFEEPVTLSAAYRIGLRALLADELMLAFYLADSETLGDFVTDKGPDRYRPRLDWLTEYTAELQRAGLVRADVDPAAASLVMSVFSVGLINASAALGPISVDQLSRTVDMVGDLISAGWESTDGPRDTEAARKAHSELLDNLTVQNDQNHQREPT